MADGSMQVQPGLHRPPQVCCCLGLTVLSHTAAACLMSCMMHAPTATCACGVPCMLQADVSDPRWGTYRQRGEALGIPVMAFDCVSQEAVATAAHLIESMLGDTDGSTVQAMVEAGAEVAIIGKEQVQCQAATRAPLHHYPWSPLGGRGGSEGALAVVMMSMR
jgi:hypothetical protein